jgi:hypothetical protein
VDGSAIEATGFAYKHPTPTSDLLKDMVMEEVKLGNFPEGFVL